MASGRTTHDGQERGRLHKAAARNLLVSHGVTPITALDLKKTAGLLQLRPRNPDSSGAGPRELVEKQHYSLCSKNIISAGAGSEVYGKEDEVAVGIVLTSIHDADSNSMGIHEGKEEEEEGESTAGDGRCWRRLGQLEYQPKKSTRHP